MDARNRIRRLASSAGVLAAIAGNVSVASAQDAPPSQVLVVQPAEVPVEIEIYYGIRKVAPIAPPAPVVEAPATHDTARAADAFIETLRSVREGTDKFSQAAANLLNVIAERTATAPEPRQIVLASYASPALNTPIPHASEPWLAPQKLPGSLTPAGVSASTAATMATPPTIVVVRESASDRAAAPEAAVPASPGQGLFLTTENLVALAVAGFGFLFGIAAMALGRRRTTVAPKAAEPLFVPAPEIDPNAIRLMGDLNAGPLPDTAERFDVGPTYLDEVKQKKQVEEANNSAAVEFILNQNLAMLAAMNPVPVVVDPDGYALPLEADAESGPAAEDDFDLEWREAIA